MCSVKQDQPRLVHVIYFTTNNREANGSDANPPHGSNLIRHFVGHGGYIKISTCVRAFTRPRDWILLKH